MGITLATVGEGKLPTRLQRRKDHCYNSYWKGLFTYTLALQSQPTNDTRVATSRQPPSMKLSPAQIFAYV
jgi:hypothetical protein